MNTTESSTNMELSPAQQGWEEISLEEINELGIDPWDPSMGDNDETPE
jgi:hypothetical protein